MPFSRPDNTKGKVELVSLIDMIFILLVFFLVTSFVIHMPLQERKLSIPTPKNELGRAQIVIQFINEDQVLWLDPSSADYVEQLENEYGYLGLKDLNRTILNQLIDRYTISAGYLSRKIQELKARAVQMPTENHFVLIRCPNHLPYYRVIQTIAALADPEIGNISYGCIGGNIQQIRECKRISTVKQTDARGKLQKNILIDF